MNVSELTEPTLIVFCLLMFIGASPGSAGGGIRTTTFAIILLTIYNIAKGRSSSTGNWRTRMSAVLTRKK